MTNCPPANYKVGNRVFFQKKQPSKWDLKWRAGYSIVHIECNRHYLHILKTKLQENKVLQCERCSEQTTS